MVGRAGNYCLGRQRDMFFYDNRDNADNGLSATCTELGWRWKLYGFMDYAERENLQDLRDFVSEASRRTKGIEN